MATTALHSGTAPLADITTVFTPTCSTSWLLTSTRLLSQFPNFPGQGPPGCDPPEWTKNLDGQGFQYYSPAICPEGFAVGTSCIISTQTKAGEGFPAIAPGETAAWCVPSGMTCTGDTTDFRGGFWGFHRDATTSNAPITYGPAIQIRFVEADLSRLATHPLTPGLILSGAETTTAPSPPGVTTIPPATTTPSTTSTSQGAPTTLVPIVAPTTLSRSTSTRSSETSTSTSSTGSNSQTNLPNDSNGNGNSNDDSATPATPPSASRADGQGQAESTTSSNTNSLGGVSGGDMRANAVIVALLSILVATLLGTLAFAFIRKRRSGNLQFPMSSMPAAIRLRVNRGQTYRYSHSTASRPRGQSMASLESVDTELGNGPIEGAMIHPITHPIAEMEVNPIMGTTLNPAELEGDAPRGRWSWMSRVSGIFPWMSHPSTSVRSSTRSLSRSRPSSRWTVNTSYTADRKSYGSEKLPGLQVPVPVKPGTAKIINIYRSKLAMGVESDSDPPPPLPEKNLAFLQAPPRASSRLSGTSVGTFGGARRASRAKAASDGEATSDGGSDSCPPSPKPEPPDKDTVPKKENTKE